LFDFIIRPSIHSLFPRPPLHYPEVVRNVALTIAGSDPSGGAGIQADLKTFHRFGVYGEAVLTLLTVQNTRSVERVVCLDPSLVVDQVRAVLSDIPPRAAKTGALGSAAVVEAVAAEAATFSFPLVVDPVMISKHGAPLIDEDARRAVRDRLLPRAALVTPNIPEASALTGMQILTIDDARRAAQDLCDRYGARAAVVKGGHFEGADATDVLYYDGIFQDYVSPRIRTPHTHGTGCTYSAAITACLASSLTLEDSVARAKAFITRAIETNPGLGGGAGPVNHFAEIDFQ
jgi:hydroxymethylpyrimidine/phosphomethylpyrimidine kinase